MRNANDEFFQNNLLLRYLKVQYIFHELLPWPGIGTLLVNWSVEEYY